MDALPVPGGRARLEDRGGELTIIIPARRRVFVMAFIVMWLGGWFLGTVSAVGQLTAPSGGGSDRGFLLFWLAGWLLGGGFAVFAVLWMAFGREILRLGRGTLVHRREVFGLGPGRAYDVSHISDLRVASVPAGFGGFGSGWAFWGFTGGPITFDYGAKTLHVGAALDEAEARQLVARLREREARLGPTGAA